MNKKVQSIEMLKKYNILHGSLETIMEKIELAKMCQQAPKSVQMDKFIASRTNLVSNPVQDLYEQIESLEIKAEMIKSEIELIDTVLDLMKIEDREILNIFFVKRPKNHVAVLCNKFQCEKSQIYRLKNRAIERFSVLMFAENANNIA